MNKLTILSAILCLYFLLGLAHASERTYYISVIPMYAHEIISTYYSPLLNYLKQESKMNWQLKFYSKHDDFMKGFCNKEIDIAFTGPIPFSYILHKCGANPLMVSLGNHGKPFYNSVIFTSNNKIKNLKSLEGLKFGYLKGSTLAHIVPFKMLDDEGVKVKAIPFKRQEEIVRAVLSGEIEAGGVKMSVFDKFKEKRLFLIKKSDDIPQFLFFAQKDLDKNVSNSFINALIKLKPLTNQRHKELTKDWDEEAKYGFILPSNDYLLKVNELWQLSQQYLKE